MGTIRNRPHSIHSGRLVAIEDDGSGTVRWQIVDQGAWSREFWGWWSGERAIGGLAIEDYPGSGAEDRRLPRVGWGNRKTARELDVSVAVFAVDVLGSGLGAG